MSLKTSNSELKERLHIIKQKLEITDKEENILKSVIDNDIFGISIILSDEGSVRRLTKEMEDIKLKFLKEYSKGDYDIFKKYYKAEGQYWDFLNTEQRLILKGLADLYKESVRKYFEDRGDLMIYRKTVNSFIVSKVKNKESITDIKEVRNYLLTNYSYHDTLITLGLNPEIGEDGFVKLNKLKLNDKGLLI